MIRKCYKFYTLIMTLMWVMAAMTASAFAVDDMWTVANRIIVDVYTKIVGITVAADSQTVRTFCEKQRAARKESGIHNCGTQRQRKGRRRCKTVKKTAG